MISRCPFVLLILILVSCKKPIDYTALPTFNHERQINAVIEIPAGTNLKLEFNYEKNAFLPDQENGDDRLIEFLPYVGNYGFIPSTYSNPDDGGDGDALDIIVLSQSEATGTVLAVKPIGVIKILDDNEIDDKIIAVPVNNDDQIVQAQNFKDLSRDYKPLMQIIELWFLNYNPSDKSEIVGWENEEQALKLIHNNAIK